MRHDDTQWESWARLMERVQQGDGEAYRGLLDQVGPVLYAFVRKRVFDPSRVDDVYQDVLLTLHKARHAYQGGRPFGPWLFTVARNAMLDSLARNRRFAEREVPTEFLPEKTDLEESGGLDDSLTKALESLPKDQRRAVELLKLEGLSLVEAARREKVTVSALKVRAHRGYEALRKRLTSGRGKP